MKLSTILLGLALTASFYSCQKTEPEAPIDNDLQAQTITNVPYGTNTRQVMDVYLAANRKPTTPFVILVHGGAWVEGDKGDMKLFADSLTRNGISAVSINYRYANATGVDLPQMMDDLSAAIAKVVTESTVWNVRKTGFVMVGVSAGAHLSLQYTHRVNTNNSIKAIIDMVGPSNLAKDEFVNYQFLLGNLPAIETLVGANWNFGANRTAFEAASPYFGLKNIPTQMFYGTDDLVVPIDQGRILKSKFADLGYTHEYTEFAGVGHDLGIFLKPNRDSISSAMLRWINTYGK